MGEIQRSGERNGNVRKEREGGGGEQASKTQVSDGRKGSAGTNRKAYIVSCDSELSKSPTGGQRHTHDRWT